MKSTHMHGVRVPQVEVVLLKAIKTNNEEQVQLLVRETLHFSSLR